MNKKGFTLVELLAVIVILSVVAMIITPNVMKVKNDSTKKLYLVDAQTFITKATYMYAQEKYLNDPDFFTKAGDNIYSINLGKIEGITNYKDPYGFTYDMENSVITFINLSDTEGSRVINVDIKSCDSNDLANCHCISGNSLELSEDSVDGVCKG